MVEQSQPNLRVAMFNILQLLLMLLLIAIIVAFFFSSVVALWMFLCGGVISLITALVESGNIRQILGQVGFKSGMVMHVHLSQATGITRLVMASNLINYILLWYGRFITLAVLGYYARKGISFGDSSQFTSLLMPRWLQYPMSLLVLSVFVFFHVQRHGFDTPGLICLWMLAICTVVFMATIIGISFSKFSSGNLTHPLVNAMLTALILAIVTVLIVAMMHAKSQGAPVEFTTGVAQVLGVWQTVQNLASEPGATLKGQQLGGASVDPYVLLALTVVGGFYLSSLKALFGGAIVGRSEEDHANLADYYREMRIFEKADAHIGKIGIDSKHRTTASTMLHIAKGQPKRAEEAAGRAISITNGVDTPYNRKFIMVMLCAFAIPNAASTEKRAELARILIDHLTQAGSPPVLTMFAIMNCLAANHLNVEDVAEIAKNLEDHEDLQPYTSRIGLLLAVKEQGGEFAPVAIAMAREHIADADADMLVRAFYFASLLAIWNASDHFIALAGEVPIPGDSFPEAIPYIEALIKEIASLPEEIETELASLLLFTLSLPLRLLHDRFGENVVSQELLGRLDDWQRQVSDDIFNLDGFKLSSFIKSIVG